VLPADFFQARQVIAESELDLLIYLDLGMDYLTRFLAHNRLARKQAMLWGHPDSTGLPAMDYMLSPDCMEPEDGERHYDETLVRLPGTVALYDRPELPTQPKGRAQCGLPEDGMLFLCPQTPFKFHPDFDPALRAILEAVEGSHLVLLAGWEGEAMMRVRDRIAGRRPDLQQRIVILDALTRPDFLTLLSLADVLLDPFHYSGGNTSLEAFAFGAPIVTWPGKYMRARHTAGFYHLMGIEDLVARDQDHYVELAVALGKSPELRRRMRQRILGRCGMLYDDRRGLWALEAFISAIGMASL
jgi:predicted O-linked N-acetylglucosamine transferase (SPINDLY family)